jgi:DNA polymerase-3 subunit delta
MSTTINPSTGPTAEFTPSSSPDRPGVGTGFVGAAWDAGVVAGRKGSAPKLGDVLLVTGAESFLADRAVRSAIKAVSKESADVEVTEADAATLDVGVFAELTGPSLFASERVLVLRALENLPADMAPNLIEYAGATSDDVLVVLVHSGGQKGKGVLDKLRKASVNEVVATAPKAWELPQFVAGEIRLHGGTVDEGAAAALVDAVGHDLRALAGACSQLVSDSGGQAVTAQLIGQYFGGRAEVTSFAVADAAIAGRTEPALEQLRWALDCGVAPVLVTSAMAGGLRGLAKYSSAPSGMREADLAREVGVPPWKLKQLKQQSRGWTPGGLATAIKAVAQADADVKGASGDAGYALERMVITVSRSHGRR